MRRLISVIAAAGLLACAANAGPQAHQLHVLVGTNTAGTATLGVSGYLEAVYVVVSDGTGVASVAVSYAPHVGATSVNVATNGVTGEKVWRPVVDLTDVNGADLSSDEPRRYALAGETVTFAVTGSQTGKTWKCVLVIDED